MFLMFVFRIIMVDLLKINIGLHPASCLASLLCDQLQTSPQTLPEFIKDREGFAMLTLQPGLIVGLSEHQS